MKQRVYIDTSVIGGCEDDEFSRWSRLLVDEFRTGVRIAVVSDVTRRELERAPESIKDILRTIPETNIEKVFLDREAEKLAQEYVNESVVGSKQIADALHIAIATTERVDVLVSWNFHHIVNLDRIRGFNAISLKTGFPLLEIRSPREIIREEEI